MKGDKHFSFGKNWNNYSKKINTKLIKRSVNELKNALGNIENKSFPIVSITHQDKMENMRS